MPSDDNVQALDPIDKQEAYVVAAGRAHGEGKPPGLGLLIISRGIQRKSNDGCVFGR